MVVVVECVVGGGVDVGQLNGHDVLTMLLVGPRRDLSRFVTTSIIFSWSFGNLGEGRGGDRRLKLDGVAPFGIKPSPTQLHH